MTWKEIKIQIFAAQFMLKLPTKHFFKIFLFQCSNPQLIFKNNLFLWYLDKLIEMRFQKIIFILLRDEVYNSVLINIEL